MESVDAIEFALDWVKQFAKIDFDLFIEKYEFAISEEGLGLEPVDAIEFVLEQLLNQEL